MELHSEWRRSHADLSRAMFSSLIFPWTLQRYIFREMFKAFLLAAVVLTGVSALGGGVFNLIKLGELTPGQLVRLMGLVVPLAAALTLPIAALFAATSTYGRLSADNEFVACRSSGINLHLLFVPGVVVSLLAAGASFWFTNFIIPRMARSLNEFVGADLVAIVQQRLSRPRGLTLGGRYRIHADACAAAPDDPNRVFLQRIAFVEVDGEEWVRHGTAKEARLRFERERGRVRVAGSMFGLSYFDRRMGHFFEEAEQVIPANELRSPVPQQLKFLTLVELFRYLARPYQWEDIQRRIDRLKAQTGLLMATQSMLREWEQRRTMTLGDERMRWVVRTSARPTQLQDHAGLELGAAEIEEHRDGQTRRITCEQATLETVRGESLNECGLQIEVRGARISDGASTLSRTKHVLGPVAIPPDVVRTVAAISEEELLTPLPEGVDPLAARRAEVRGKRDEVVRKIVGVLHERVTFSASVLFLVVLGAALGIVFRGSHVMTAFGISFVPVLFVIVAIVAGRQLTVAEHTHGIGILAMWGGIGTVVLLDALALTWWVRR